MEKQTFICSEAGSRFYLVDSGMGGAFNPPGHAEHFFSIHEQGNGEGYYSLTSAIEKKWMPEEVKRVSREALKLNPGDVTSEAWIRQVYTHFRHCYSKDGSNRNVTDCLVYSKWNGNADEEKNENPERHLGCLFVKKFDPSHKPRTDLF
jgi:hypothetical protein